MKKAQEMASFCQKPAFDKDVSVAVRATVARITASYLWISVQSAWSPKDRIASSRSADEYFEHGMVSYGRGDYGRAIADFQAALQLDWRHEDALTWLGMAERAANEAETSHYRSALSLIGLGRGTAAVS